jgi:hypothetical protein
MIRSHHGPDCARYLAACAGDDGEAKSELAPYHAYTHFFAEIFLILRQVKAREF